jgi:hypothetical protein
MKQKNLLLLMMVLGLGLMAAPALASNVSLNLSHQLTFTMSGLTFSGVDDTPGFEPFASVSGDASWLSGSEGPVSVMGDMSAQYSGNPILNMSAQTSNPNPGLTMTHILTGNTPGDAGSLNMWAQSAISLVFTGTGGAASLTLDDLISGIYAVSGQGGSPWFDSLTLYSALTASNGVTVGPDALDNTMLGRFPDFNNNLASSFSYVFDLGDLVCGEQVYLDLAFDTNLYGTSQVPLPPSVLLLGSGLAGLVSLAGLRRRKQRS